MLLTADEKLKSFSLLGKESKEVFLPVQFANSFPDTTFSMLYAWNERFHYTYRPFGNSVAVLGEDTDGLQCCMLIGVRNITNLPDILLELYRYFYSIKQPLVIKYISEDELPIYRDAAKKHNLKTTLYCDDKYSDYIYETEEFISMKGNRNKGKRGDYNYLLRCMPNIRCEYCTPDKYEELFEIFNIWCGQHDCEKCYYGCEKWAFRRFMEIYDSKRHTIAIAYGGRKPISFAVSEKINPHMVCYYFQKNAVRQRGLTYWLNREMALRHTDVPYINLGEDMGIEGLKTDKTNLHPCRKNRKYQILLSSGANENE